MSLESLDQVQRGDWLVCTNGPMLTIRDDLGTFTTRNKEMIGSLFRVIGITPPIMLGWVYHHKNDTRVLASIHWTEASWSKAHRIYVKNYLKFGRCKKERRKRKPNDSKTILAPKYFIPPPGGSTN